VLRRRFEGVRCPPPAAATAAGLAQAMLDAAVPPPVLFARGDRSRGDLPRALRARGIPVRTAVVYRTVPAPDPAGRLPACDVVVLGSPSAAQTARGIVSPRAAIVAIGDTTARTARALGLAVRAVAPTPDVPGVVLAIRSILT
jgi:uroporphyrinogen-III synthase